MHDVPHYIHTRETKLSGVGLSGAQQSKEVKTHPAGYSCKVTPLAFIHRRVRPLGGVIVVPVGYHRGQTPIYTWAIGLFYGSTCERHRKEADVTASCAPPRPAARCGPPPAAADVAAPWSCDPHPPQPPCGEAPADATEVAASCGGAPAASPPTSPGDVAASCRPTPRSLPVGSPPQV